MAWETKKNLRAKIDRLEGYNRFLRGEVRRQHFLKMRLRDDLNDVLSGWDREEKDLFLDVHDMRRDDESSDFNLGWNQAVGHVEKLIKEYLGIDLESAMEGIG